VQVLEKTDTSTVSDDRKVSHKSSEELLFRKPSGEDGAQVWELIKRAGTLDLNSSYSYIMLCEFFPETCVIAEQNNQIVGFVSAFRPPIKENVIFVWQIAVDSSQRGKGLGKRLLHELLKRQACQDVRYLEATISPSNVPSQSLFRSLANSLDTDCEVSECFPEEYFPGSGHEEELLFRIGPF
jgi:L-2,4-diaminobutyric acid acetyltransferase